ncbi:ATP-dependent DNA helicase [Roseisalinus antarcticus]|jgi:exodeoxyribonuclease-5|uniref:ATP-dependent RecD-like DNA helicase n=1 Tax=Roseisalinus antarcticus TaxID=254357 RepID=A0A1Y5U6F1_9RHOB|nr:AAA family ATPase [Roseisalinus antarcticus]SLN77854.1 ATP-dependent RecD-like DNA helicase [Roseisalinus antarcticus]
MSLTLSEAQTRAIAAIRDWYLHRTHAQQVFRVFGYAGVGKTTITAMAIEALGLRPMTPGGLGGVIFAAFTGKAVHVMTQKGTPAQTIHSLIYRFSEATPDEIARVTEELAALERDLPRMGVAERSFAETQIRQLKFRLDHIHEPRFVLNTQSALRDADLLVLDEVSMVGTDMAQDLMAFGKPILVLGDPGQLPPVKDTGFFTEATPDVMLTEVYRQAAESPILQLATLAREGRDIPFGAFDDQVWKMSRHEVSPAQMLQGGQVICGTHATRRRLNTAMKGAAGFEADYPAGAGEKIICLRNRHDLGLINGMFLHLSDVQAHPRNDRAFRATVRTEDGTCISGAQDFWRGEFDDHVRFDPDRHRREWMACRGLIQSSWGYAITCHKSQGSQYPTVIVVDDGFGHTAEDRKRWLYTAITRAEHGLLILA